MAIIFGTRGDNVLSSNKRGDIILGLDGDDTLEALHGFNILLGGDGDDILTALSSFNILSGGEGDDTLRAYFGWNLLLGGNGDDDLASYADGNILDGGDGDDSLSVQSDFNTLIGGDGDDLFNILGGSGNTVRGGDGRDTLSYAGTTQGAVVNLAAGSAAGIIELSGIENVTGSEGDDFITGDGNDNVLHGGGGNDTLEGGAGNDIVDGGAGDDLIIGGEGAGDDIYQGGDGNDTVSYASTTQGVTASLASGMAAGAEIGTDTLVDIENLVGGAGNDILTGDANANLLDGDLGDDTINGGAGDDILIGGEGFDTLSYDDSPNRVIVNMFNTSTIQGVLPGTASDGFGSIDTISGFEAVIGSDYDDYIQGSTNVANLLMGGDGNDTLAGSGMSDGINPPEPLAANDTLMGGAGNDLFRQSRGNDVIDGGEDFDTLIFVNTGIPYGGTTGVNVNLEMGLSDADPSDGDPVHLAGGDVATISGIEGVVGTAGNDTLIGDANANFLDGQDGNDSIKGGAGNDVLSGGEGFDTLSYEDSPNRVIVNMFSTGVITIGGITLDPGHAFDGFGLPSPFPPTDTVSGFEAVIGSAFDDHIQGSTNVANLLIGGAGNDTLAGSGMSDGINSLVPGAANDTLLGGAGNDVLRQSRGNDIIDGGEGSSDRLEFFNTGIPYGGTSGVNVNLALGFSDADPNNGDLVHGPGGDVATISGIEQVFGTLGNDMLTGGSLARNAAGGFTEVFRGSAGNDTIDGQGADFAQGAYDIDRVEYIDAPGPVWVNFAAGIAFDGFGTMDTLLHVNHVMGSSFNDTLIGGNREYDYTFERFEGRGGDDFMDGGSGIDEVSYQNASGPVTVNLGSGTGGGVSFDTFINMEGVRGSPFGDTLLGSDNLDVVEHFIGDGGDDFINGGAGLDFASWQGVALTAGGVNAFIENGAGMVFSPAGIDTLVNIEGLIGTNSNDTLAGGMGDQWLRGRGGSDIFDGGADSDTADYSMDPGAVTVNLATGTALDGWGGIWGLQGNDQLTSIENIVGSHFSDTLTGDDNANVIQGLGGNDILAGGGGFDTLSYDDSPNRVIVNLFNTSTITVGGITVDPGHAFDGFTPLPAPVPPPTDTVSGFEAVIGSAFNDWIQGSTNVANLLMGGAGNDTLAGSGASDGISPPVLGAANDTLFGGSGNDVFRQSRGNDVIDGGEGFDQLEFTNNGITYGGPTGSGVSVNLELGLSDADPSGTDTVHGAGGEIATVSSIELVVGTGGNDVFTGGDPLHAPGFESGQVEFFRPLGGADTITGKTGRGWSTGVDYLGNNNAQPVHVVLGNGDNLGTASDGFGFTDTLIEVDNVRGGAGNDLLVGGSYSQGASGVFVEAFRGNFGNDTIDGGGSDTVIGAYGVTDRVEYNNSPFAVVVNTGVTPVFGTPYGTVDPGTARDGFDFLGGGTDTLIDINVVRASNANDTLVGGNPKFDNHERFEGLAGNDFIDGGSGNDEADYSSSTAPVLVNLGLGTGFDGFGGTDTLVNVEWVRGSDFDDTLVGGANALERFTGGRGNDLIDGGSMAGVNYASFVLGAFGASASIENGTGMASSDGQGGTDTLININGLWGTNYADTLTGGLGNQWFVGGGGNDTIDGGADSDTVSYRADPNGITVNLAMNSATDGWGGIWGLQGTDTLSNIENIEGSSFDDTLIGDANANVIKGGAGDDILAGGDGFDTLSYEDSPNRAIVNMFNTSTITVGSITVDPGHAFDGFTPLPAPVPLPTDTVSGFEAVIGSAFNDYIQGSTNVANLLIGGAGNDTLAGSGGSDGISPPVPDAANDTLLGGAGNDLFRQSRGNDVIDGGEDFDSLIFVNTGIPYGGITGVSVNLALGFSDADPNNGDTVHGAGGDIATVSGVERVVGTAGNDTLIGDANANQLEGQGGDDTIDGGGGADTLIGNAGIDTFKYHATSDSSANLFLSDFIIDFLHATDKIDLSAIDANTGLDGNQDFLFGGNNASTVANSVTWSESGGVTTVLQIDNDGDAIADMQLILLGTGLGLSDADFIL